MKTPLHPSLWPIFAVADGVEIAARELVRVARQRSDGRKPKTRRGGTLRPSAQTPLWNTVVALVQPHLKRRGDRAILARELGVHRARVREYFDQQSAMPDAERTIQLLIWLSQKNKHPSSQKTERASH